MLLDSITVSMAAKRLCFSYNICVFILSCFCPVGKLFESFFTLSCIELSYRNEFINW